MRPFPVPGSAQVSEDAKLVFEQFQRSGGKMPNLYATIAYSSNALSSYLQYTRMQAKGSFHAKDREGIYLIVSQLNECRYCLASHTQSAIKSGWKEEETIAIRDGTHPERKWQILYKAIRSVIEFKGEMSDVLQDEFFSLGYKEAGLIDLMVLINLMSFTNYVYRLTNIPIDFPEAKAI